MAPLTPEYTEKRSATKQPTARTHHAHRATHVDLPAAALELSSRRGSNSCSREWLDLGRTAVLLGSPHRHHLYQAGSGDLVDDGAPECRSYVPRAAPGRWIDC